MALSSTFTIPAGVDIASLQSDSSVTGMTLNVEKQINAYLKIKSLSGGKDGMTISLGVQSNGQSQPIMTKQYSFTPLIESGDNFIKQAYLYLKTLEEFSNAEDV